MLSASPGSRQAANRWWGGGLRGKTVIGVAAVAAVAAAIATMIVLPASSSHSGTRPQAGTSARPTVKAKPGKAAAAPNLPETVPTTSPAVNYTFTAETTDVTAAYVLQQAAQATPATQAAGVRLVNGWPDAPYWHTESQSTDSACPGQVVTSNVWVNPAGNGVTESETTGPKSSNPICGSGSDGAIGLSDPGGGGAQIGGRLYTWAQFAALPTDPAKLWPIVKADMTVGVATEKGEPVQDFLFQTIGMLLTSEPVSPAMQKALYEVSEKIPGVTVVGQYTDSLGRTGTALRLGSWTMVVDTGNGQVLATLSGAPPIPPGCVRASESGDAHAMCTVSGAGTEVFISAGPASAASLPKVPSAGGTTPSSLKTLQATPPESS